MAGITTDQLRAQLGIAPADTDDDEWLTQCVDAVNAWVSGLPVVADRSAPAPSSSVGIWLFGSSAPTSPGRARLVAKSLELNTATQDGNDVTVAPWASGDRITIAGMTMTALEAATLSGSYWHATTDAQLDITSGAREVITTPAAPDWTADVQTGAVLLAAHLYHSRNAPYGRATIDLAGGFNQAYADPEIARYLRLRRWAKPMISGPA